MKDAQRRIAEQECELFRLRTLYDTARELARLSEPAEVLRTFLLMSMGPLGVRQGFAMLQDLTGGPSEFCSRGFSEERAEALRSGAEQVREELFGPCASGAGQVEVLEKGLEVFPFLGPEVRILVRWCGPGTGAGLVGLGAPLAGDCGVGDAQFVARLAGLLVDSLRGALSTRERVALTADLGAKNRDLERALARADAVQAELDRQIFRLDSLYEATMELSAIVDPRGLLDAFLLTVMGVFGAREGGVYLHGRGVPMMVLRGARAVPDDLAQLEASQRGLAEFFADVPGGGERHMGEGMNVTVLSGEKQLAGASFPFPARVAVAFSVDGNVRGLMALGERLDGGDFEEADHQLLRAHVGKALSHIRNALAFEDIVALNADLIRRNEELGDLLEEVGAVRMELSDVERTKERILAVVRRETTRTGSVRRMDFVLILALAVVIGLVFNFSNPAGLSLVPASWSREAVPGIDAEWLRLRMESGAPLILDARPAEFYRRWHLRGAVNMPRALFDFVYSMRLASLDPATRVVVYGRTLSSLYDEDVAAMLRDRGFSDVAVLRGDREVWEAKGLPMEYEQ